MLFHHGKHHHLYLQKDNNIRELKYNQTQPNSTEPRKMFRLHRDLMSDQLLGLSSLKETGRERVFFLRRCMQGAARTKYNLLMKHKLLF